MPRFAFFSLWIASVAGLVHPYKVFRGDGSLAQGWPDESEWLSFDDLWSLNMWVLNSSCKPIYGKNNSPLEIDYVKKFIPEAALYANVPQSLLFSMMMQESDGCVRVGSTAAAVANPGLMQSNNGEGNCAGIQPCPPEMIKMMLMDGAGKDREFGLNQALKLFNGTQSPERYYRAARAYNAGPFGVAPLHLEEGGATRCYASDIANRLLGWNRRADTACDFDQPHARLNSTTTRSFTSTPQASTSVSVTRLASGTSDSCSVYHLVESEDTCYKVAGRWNTTFEQLRRLNPSLDGDCTNLWRDYWYCIAI